VGPPLAVSSSRRAVGPIIAVEPCAAICPVPVLLLVRQANWSGLLNQHLWGIAAAAVAASCLGAASAAPKEKVALALGLKGTSTYSITQEATKPLKGSPVPNLGVVAPGCVYRSGQPSKAGYEWLKEQGFKSIVCLRKEHDDDAAEMAKYGFHYLYLPIVDETAPTKEQAETFLKFAANPDNWPLVVHCHGGE